MKKIRFALVGCSSVAKKHLESLRQLDSAEIAAVCDLNAVLAEKTGREYGVPHYQDYRSMLEKENVDVVTVLTPSGDHAERVLDLVKFGKHIVVEKPMALRLEDADAMIHACDTAGIKLFVVKQNRYNVPVRALRAAIDAGRFGRLVMGTVRVRWCRKPEYYSASPWRGTWAFDGGVLTNQASHHIDMLEWLMGDVESVTAMTATRLAPIEAEDTAVAILRFRSGALGVIEATTAARPIDLEGSVSVLGETGSVVIGGFAMDKLQTWQFTEPASGDAGILAEHGQNPSSFAYNHREYLRAVVETIQSGRKALVDGLEGRKSLELINALYESVETGREVPLRFRPKKCRLGERNNGNH
ncbi:MAG: Gfo/Idh/MocA family oxidoreductase [Elusimicrobiota bacterium]